MESPKLAERVARQLTEAFPWNEAPRYMIHDRDRIYGAVVTRRLRAMGIRNSPITPASPWQNGFAERPIGSIRRESVAHADIDPAQEMETRIIAVGFDLRPDSSVLPFMRIGECAVQEGQIHHCQ